MAGPAATSQTAQAVPGRPFVPPKARPLPSHVTQSMPTLVSSQESALCLAASETPLGSSQHLKEMPRRKVRHTTSQVRATLEQGRKTRTARKRRSATTASSNGEALDRL